MDEQPFELRINYYRSGVLTSVVDVNEGARIIEVTHYTGRSGLRLFGGDDFPTYDEFVEFVRSRCDEKQLANPFFDPISDIEQTHGVSEDDDIYLEVLWKEES